MKRNLRRMRQSCRSFAVSSLGIVALTTCAQASAEEQAPQVSPTDGERADRSRPNQTMLQTGFWAFAISYVAAVVVAADSNRSGDKSLYVPIVGPWIDIGSRGRCPPRASCDRELLSSLLIAADGIFQGLGVLDFGAAFLVREQRTIANETDAKRKSAHLPISVRIAPGTSMMKGCGIAIVGRF